MNILIPHSWLLEHVKTDAKPAEMQEFLSLCGPSIERIYEREGDSVYDIEVTTNRVDSMSVRGIAREAAVILKHFGKKAQLKPLQINEVPKATHSLKLPEIIDDEKLCKRTMCIVLADVQRNATPAWMAKRLRQIDGNVHDAVIDITNYITHELGHPCHAFDYDKVMELGGIIEVKTAAAGKKFKTLDGAEYTTVGGEVVFENGEGLIIDLPGIKGTANTSIQADTKNILFWLENIEAKKIRFASMTHAIRTVAAQLNEKNVDPSLAEAVLKRGVELFVELTNAKVASKVYDHFPAQKKSSQITVPLNRIQDYLGVELPINQMAQILEDLECEVSLKEGKLLVTPPTFRPDLQIQADIIEEIARIYGYHNLPSVLMPTAIPLDRQKDVNFAVESKIKHFLSDLGWQETYSYSMVSEAIAKQSGYALSEHIKIQNPLSDDRVYMRRSLIPSLLEFMFFNRTVADLQVYEMAKVYNPKEGDIPEQPVELSLLSTKSYREVKGLLEALYQQFFVKELQIRPKTTIKEALLVQEAEIVVEENGVKHVQGIIGVMGNGMTAITISLTALLSVIKSHPTYQPLPKTGEIHEDITFTLPPKTLTGNLIDVVKKVSPYLAEVQLKGIYQQNFTFTFSYHNPAQNLTAEDITPLRKQIVKQVEKQFGGKLIGKLE